MYESFYNFKAEPFRLSPDHRFCFSHKSYAKAKAYMQYAIHRAEGFVMVTGKPGTGKTTLVNDLVEGLSNSQIVVATIVSTQLEADDLLRLVACNFGLDIDAPNKAVVLQGLSVRLRRHHEEGTRALLIIDEAQDLSASALEELRLLTNLQLDNQPLLQIFLIGQENLRDLVQRPSMEQVHQRLVAACHLESLNEEDTKAYIRHRLDRVGWKDDPTLDEGVFSVAYQFSKGIPRRINLVCSRFLLHGSVEEKHRIRASDVRTVVQELQHEQLTPIGFKAELPPLSEEDDIEEAPPVSKEAQQEKLSKEELEEERQEVKVKENSLVTEALSETISDQATELTSLKELNNSLEMLIKESNEDSLERQANNKKTESQPSQSDVIQEDYFSLGDVVDSISEPIPIGEGRKSKKGSRYGYGDRFAKAQRKTEQTETTTHFYNEYQSRGVGAEATHKKRGVFSTILLFMVIFGILFAGIYILRPQILESEITYAEGKFGQYLDYFKDNYLNKTTTPAVFDEQILEKEKALNAIHPDIDEEVTSSGDLIPESTTVRPVIKLPVSYAESTGGYNTDSLKNNISTIGKETSQSEKVINTVDSTLPRLSEVVAAGEKSSLTADNLSLVAEQSEQQPSSVVAPKIIESVQVSHPQVGENLDETELSIDKLDIVTDARNVVSVSSTRLNSTSVNTKSLKSDKGSIFYQLSQNRAAEKLEGFKREENIHVLFKSDSTEVDSQFYAKLDDLTDRLTQYKQAKALIIGYADSSGDPYYNQKLSAMRANAVAAYLVNNNIPVNQLVVEGRGVYPENINAIEDADARKKIQRMVEITLMPSESGR
ncbi:MAG: XrtA-associated ATPase [Sedimenticola sp.]|nr:XrtA-associated ATPase [Sedimenticola sp.]